MSVDYLPRVDRRPVPAPNNNLNISLSSNNPFRRGVSPNISAAAKGPAPAPPTTHGAFINNENEPFRSTNPFLDNYQAPSYPISIPAQNARQSPSRQMPAHGYSQSASPKKPGFHVSGGAPTKMMNGMTISDRPAVGRRSPPRAGQPPSSFRPVPSNHRHSRSNDENMRAGIPRSPEKLVDIFATPEKDKPAPGQFVRRNSDTSVMDDKEQRRKAREARAKEGKYRDPSKKSKKPNPQMDLIDKLDITSIYGTGMFHHDGPFDACNPHRNRKGTKAAPMHAFPEGSANNTMGGSGPVNKALDIDKFHGRMPDGFNDFNSANAPMMAAAAPPQDTIRLARPGRQDRRPSAEPVILLDGRQKVEMVHGEQSAGLGTSTFLEGAPVPASRLALQRAVSQQDNAGAGAGGGLARKKSLAQRIRGISRPRGQGFGDAGRVLSPDARYSYADDGRSALTPPVPALDAQSAGGRGKMVEINPFFHEEAIGQAKTTNEGFTIEMPEKAAGRHRGISSPQPLYRTKTNDSTGGNDGADGKPASSGGLLSRVKSMRGGRRPTRERRDT